MAITAPVPNVKLLQKEKPAADFVPYTVQLDPHTVKTSTGMYVRTMRLNGMAHESADDESINTAHEQLNVAMRNLHSTDTALWSHIIRRKESVYPRGNVPAGFARQFDNKYRERVTRENMWVNELYGSIVYQPENAATRLLSRLLSKEEKHYNHAESLRVIDEKSRNLRESLGNYSPELLGTYQHNGITFSEPLEFLAYLINGKHVRVPLQRMPLNSGLTMCRPWFGREALALRMPDSMKVGAILGFEEYPKPTMPGMLNDLLTLPCEFVLSQSFAFMDKALAITAMTTQRDKMLNAGDLGVSEIEEINEALDQLVRNEYVMGLHHFSLLVLADVQTRPEWTQEEAERQAMAKLTENIAQATTALSNAGVKVAREDLAMQSAFYAQLPGNFKYRPRRSMVTSRNFAAFSSFHNFPTGKKEGNRWGPALMLLQTTANSPLYFNYHVREVGDTLDFGPKGSGKTAGQLAMLTQAQKYEPNTILYDKDNGGEIWVRAMGGRYHSFESGKPTGFSLFKHELTEDYEHFLMQLLGTKCARSSTDEPIGDDDFPKLFSGIRRVYSEHQPQHRRMGTLLQYLPYGSRLFKALSRWGIYDDHGNARVGQLWWVFDNEEDTLDFTQSRIMGFDYTEFLDDDELRTPIMMNLFYHQKKVISETRKTVIFIDEFQKAIEEPFFEQYLMKEILATGRKKDTFLIAATQEPAEALKSRISHYLLGETATKIFRCNPNATKDIYIDGCGLTEAEFELVKYTPEEARCFLVKQENRSVMAKMNLTGMDDELAVLSGNKRTVPLVRELIDHYGDDPKVWLPIFHQERRFLA